ncbi:MAG: hypothetical protein HOM07_07675 [Rhodospirillaceae bacterium]|jgi:hypothetical protein|nr:hypothetical protein [Rhodospirillaceae bacterium]MBT5458976.1 hypothetical protein [Rhodospirillaceae bacterium]
MGITMGSISRIFGTLVVAIMLMVPASATYAAPTITKITSTLTGYVIEGRGFGRSAKRVRIFEGKQPVSSRKVKSVTDRRITILSKPRGRTSIRVTVGRTSSNPKSFSYRTPRARTTKTTRRAKTGTITRAPSTTTRRRAAGTLTKIPSSMTDRELEAHVRKLKSEGKSPNAAARALKNARVVGDKAYRAIMKIYNKPVEFMISLMRSVRYGFRSFAGNLRKHTVQRGLDWLLGALKKAGYTPSETTFTLKTVLKFGQWALLTSWHRIGEKADRYMPAVVRHFGTKAGALIDWMKSQNFTLKDIWLRIKQVYRPSGKRMVEWLDDQGFSAIQIAKAAKDAVGAGARDAAKWLKARFTASETGQALVRAFNVGGEAATKALVYAGYTAKQAISWAWGKFSPGVNKAIKWLKAAGVSSKNIVSAIKDFSGVTGKKIVSGLKAAGYSATTTARAVKDRLNASANKTAKWLVQAGFPVNSVASGIKSAFNASASAVIRALAFANVAFTKIVTAIVNAFNMSAASATALITSLGVR